MSFYASYNDECILELRFVLPKFCFMLDFVNFSLLYIFHMHASEFVSSIYYSLHDMCMLGLVQLDFLQVDVVHVVPINVHV